MALSAIAAMSGVPVPLLTAASGTPTSLIVAPPMSFRNHQLIFKSSAGMSAGTMQIETTDDLTDTGTWAQVAGGPVDVSVANQDVIAELTGIYRFLRVRGVAALVGGTLSVNYSGGKNY